MAGAGYLPAALSCFRKAAAADAQQAAAAHLALAMLCDQLLQARRGHPFLPPSSAPLPVLRDLAGEMATMLCEPWSTDCLSFRSNFEA